MEENVRFFTVDRHIGGSPVGDGIWWSSDILVLFILCKVLCRIRFYGLWNIVDYIRCCSGNFENGTLTVGLLRLAFGTVIYYD